MMVGIHSSDDSKCGDSRIDRNDQESSSDSEDLNCNDGC
jgi:hypothetical protein